MKQISMWFTEQLEQSSAKKLVDGYEALDQGKKRGAKLAIALLVAFCSYAFIYSPLKAYSDDAAYFLNQSYANQTLLLGNLDSLVGETSQLAADPSKVKSIFKDHGIQVAVTASEKTGFSIETGATAFPQLLKALRALGDSNMVATAFSFKEAGEGMTTFYAHFAR